MRYRSKKGVSIEIQSINEMLGGTLMPTGLSDMLLLALAIFGLPRVLIEISLRMEDLDFLGFK